MANIWFRDLPLEHASRLRALFDYLRPAKDEERIEADELAVVLGPIVASHFWHPSPEELRDWQARWEATPVRQRWNDPTLKTPWCFESWVEAIANAEIAYTQLRIEPDGSGELEFEQLACPSGGLESSEQIPLMFGATIVDKYFL